MEDKTGHDSKVFFEGVSAPVRYLLAGCLAILALLFLLPTAKRSPESTLMFFLIDSVCVPLVLVLIAPRRFVLVGRAVAGWLFVLCSFYVAYQWLAPSSFLAGGLGAPNKFNSVRAMLFVGLPGGWYAWKGKLI